VSRAESDKICAVPAVAAIAGLGAVAAYADAKYHIRHDLKTAGNLNNAATQAQEFVAKKQAEGLEDHALSDHSDHLFLEYEDRSWTYRQFYDDVQKVGNWLITELGVRKGEIVAIDGANSAEYVLLWYALEAVGASIAFINSHLTGTPLVHSVKVVCFAVGL
jgi:acyl-CoA synthetase (AMP-forming)/AMP-acid ligase II